MTVSAHVQIIVDDTDVRHLLDTFEDSVTPISLERLLSGGVADALRYRAQNRFTSEGDGASGKWAALRPATEDIREFLGYPRAHPINKRSGELRKFIGQSKGSAVTMPDGAAMIWPELSRSGDIEDKLEVAQRGSPRGANPWFLNARTPARPVVALDQVDVALVLVAVSTHLETSMRAGGFSVIPI